MSNSNNSNIKYEKLSEENYNDYEVFLKQFESTLIYHSEPFLRTLIKSFGFQQETLILKRNNIIEAILPLLSIKGELGTVYNSLPFFGSYGGIYSLNKYSQKKLLEHYNSLVNKKDFFSSTIIQNPFHSFDRNDFNYEYEDLRIAQFTNIEFSSDIKENLFKGFHSKTKNMIRKSEKFDINIQADLNKVEEFYDLHKIDMLNKKGIPKPLHFFSNLIKIMPKDNIKLLIAYINGKFAAGLLLLYYNRTVEYFTPVVKVEYKNTQVLSKIIFEAMIEASSKGFKTWNWGGTWFSQNNVHRFKKRWSTHELTYSYLTSINKTKITNSEKEFYLEKYPFSFVLPFDKLQNNFYE